VFGSHRLTAAAPTTFHGHLRRMQTVRLKRGEAREVGQSSLSREPGGCPHLVRVGFIMSNASVTKCWRSISRTGAT